MYNKITIVGNVGRDPEMRYTRNGTPVTNFNVPSNHRYYVTAEDGSREQREETNWFRIQAFGSIAENCERYVTKGMLVLVEGRLNQDEYTDNEGNSRASLNVIASAVRFLSNPQAQAEVEGANGGETPNVGAPPENPPSEGPVNRQGYPPQNNPQGYGADGTNRPYSAPPNEQRYPNYPQRPNYGSGQPNYGGGQPQYGGGYAQPTGQTAPKDDWLG